MIDCFEWVREREDIDKVVIVGEIGGDGEEMLAKYIIDSGLEECYRIHCGEGRTKRKAHGPCGSHNVWRERNGRVKNSSTAKGGSHSRDDPHGDSRTFEKAMKTER